MNKRKNNICKNGHLVLGQNAIITKRGHIRCRKCKILLQQKAQRTSKDLPKVSSEEIDDRNMKLIFIPNGDDRLYYNLGYRNRQIKKSFND